MVWGHRPGFVASRHRLCCGTTAPPLQRSAGGMQFNGARPWHHFPMYLNPCNSCMYRAKSDCMRSVGVVGDGVSYLKSSEY
jgi:hypothetical protein